MVKICKRHWEGYRLLQTREWLAEAAGEKSEEEDLLNFAEVEIMFQNKHKPEMELTIEKN